MLDVPSILKRAADKCGFTRTRWVEKDIPNTVSNICVIVFFGDIRSSFVLSSMILKRYREQIKGSKYIVLCTWPGYETLFPYVNETWVIRDESILRKFAVGAYGFGNTSDLAVQFQRELNHWFEDVIGPDVFESLYDNGIKEEFWEKFKHIRRYLLSVPSSSVLGDNFNLQLVQRGGAKVFLYPSEYVRSWQRGNLEWIKCPKEFWLQLTEDLIAAQLMPVVYQNHTTHNLSTEMADRCIYTTERDVTKVLGMMRTVGCVLDIFSGISRWAMAARAPFIAFDERLRYNGQMEYEIDDLLSDKTLPRHYIFSFPTIINSGNSQAWKNNFNDVLLSFLVPFVAKLNRDNWPSPLEREELVLYSNVRERKLKKIGTKLFKVNRDLR